MSDYNNDIDPNVPVTESELDSHNVINEYNGAPLITEDKNEEGIEVVDGFNYPYTASKKIIVKRYKLKKN